MPIRHSLSTRRLDSTTARTRDPKLRTNVHIIGLVPIDAVVKRYKELNKQIVHGLPEMARAYDSLRLASSAVAADAVNIVRASIATAQEQNRIFDVARGARGL